MKPLVIAVVLVAHVAQAAPPEDAPTKDDRITYALFGGAAVFGIYAAGEAEVAFRMQDEAVLLLPTAKMGDPIFQRDYGIALDQRNDARRNAFIAGGGMVVLAGLGTWRALHDAPSPHWFDRSWKIRAGCDAVALAAYAMATSLPYTEGGDGGHISDATIYLGLFSLGTYGLCAPIVHAYDGDGVSAGLSFATNVAVPLATYYGASLIAFDNPYNYKPSTAPLWVGPAAAMAIDLFMIGKLDRGETVVVEPRPQGAVVSFGGRF